ATARLGKPHPEQAQIGTRHGGPPYVRVACLRRAATHVRDKWSSNDRTRLIGPLASSLSYSSLPRKAPTAASDRAVGYAGNSVYAVPSGAAQVRMLTPKARSMAPVSSTSSTVPDAA